MKRKRIHICHLVYSFNTGGLERVIANMINKLDGERFEHTIISLTDVGSFINEIDGDVNYIPMHKRQGNDFSLYLKLYKLFIQLKPDVLHSYNLATIEYQFIGLLARIPKRVHAEHGRDSYDPKGDVRKYQLIRRVCAYAIHNIVTVSSELEQWLLNTVKIPPQKTSLIGNGVDTVFYNRSHVQASAENYYDDKFVFGHVARLHPIKNQQFILEAFEKACSYSEPFKQNCALVFVGDGPDCNKLKKYVADSKLLKKKVVFEGNRSNVRDYYFNFDVFVMASINEGVPMTLLEAMSMEVPHLIIPVGGINDVTIANKTGLIVSSHDTTQYSEKLIEAFEDKQTLRIMAKCARSLVVNKFSENNCIQSYTELYTR
ncbi:glycosyltransferase [Vibrio sp. HN007]|uniref:glycosyltransferase n=1 Tax=Vibrio iocasae TaxID=3098914 RepID=UPI0035D4E57A